MNFKIKLLPEARLDIKDNIDWYNQQKTGLGKLFYEAVKSRFAYLKQNPLHYQVNYRNMRNALVDQFPYQVHYRVEEARKEIIVLGITHTSRNPKVWKSRK